MNLELSLHNFPSPFFDFEAIPPEERDATWALQRSIGALSTYIIAFKAALDLFDLSRFLVARSFINQQYHKWMSLAARDGAMTVYHFGHTLMDGNAAKDCPTVQRLMTPAKIRLARRRFEANFPNFISVRHAVAHDAEITDSMDSFDQNVLLDNQKIAGIVGSLGGNIFKGIITDSTFSTTHEGKVVRYDISKETLKFLAEIAAQFYDGFAPATRQMPPSDQALIRAWTQ